jgi:Asp/Glu/hydantoin racemase
MLRGFLPSSTPVVGIFEASISTSLSLLSAPRLVEGELRYQKCGIVTTGQYWEKVLTDGVVDLLGFENSEAGARTCKRFKGVESTGLTAVELHTADPEEVRSRMMAATRRLVKDGDVRVVCLGCAGMAGMDAMVREACVQELGEVEGGRVRIVDGVKAAIALADGLARA